MSGFVNRSKIRNPDGIFGAGFQEEIDTQDVQHPSVHLTVWGHDQFSSPYDVVIDMSLVPFAKEGEVAELYGAEGADGKRRNFYFVIRPKPESSNAQISVSSAILTSLEIPARSTVEVRLKSKWAAQIDQAELHFRGVHLTRSDLYQISKELTGEMLRVGQRVTRLGGLVRLTVDTIHRNGKKKYSGFVGPHTRLVYRSDSARLILLIQMSEEMWTFDETGDVAFQKLVNSFIPASLRQLSAQGDKHSVSIIFFTSIGKSNRKTRLVPGELEPNSESYFRVVIDQLPVSRWTEILQALRAEFARFSQDVLVNEDGKLVGQVLPSSKGNLLEAISLTTTFASQKFSDRDLCRTNLQAIIITPSPGLFDVHEEEMYRVSKEVMNVEMGVELVCLSRPPLHITPMFRARDKHGNNNHYIPTWVNVSFWNTRQRYVKQWLPRARIYDIQMMGVMENEIKAISLRHLAPGPYTSRFMKNYDVNVFKSEEMIHDERKVEEAASNTSSISLLKPLKTITPSHTVSVSTDTIATVPPIHIKPTATFNPPLSLSSASASASASTAEVAPPSHDARKSLGNILRTATARDRRPAGIHAGLNRKSSSSSLKSAMSLFSGTGIRDKKPPAIHPEPPSLAVDSIPQISPLDQLIPITDTIKPVNAPAQPSLREMYQGLSPPRTTQSPQQLLRTSPQASMPMPIPSNRPNAFRPSLQRHAKLALSPSSHHSPPAHLRGTRRSVAHAEPLSARSAEFPTEQRQTVGTWKNPHRDMWRVLKNPSVIDMPSRIQAYGKWAYVYAPGIKRKIISWNSLKSPASLPLTTEYFPLLKEWQTEYKFQFYDLAVGLNHEDYTAGQLLDEMIRLRLQMGFQIAVGDAVLKVESKLPRGDPSLVAQVIPKHNYIGLRIYMIREGLIHRLSIEQDGLINVQLFTWRDPDEALARSNSVPKHPIKIRTKADDDYHSIDHVFYNPLRQFDINWNQLDQQLAGLDDFIQNQEPYHIRIRFLLIPTSDAGKSDNYTQMQDKLSAEELRVEGITKVVNTVTRNRYNSDKKAKSTATASDLYFYTGDLGRALGHMYEDTLDEQNRDELFQKDRLNKNIKLNELANEIYGKWGPRLRDRRWHWKSYHRVLVGIDLVNWLIDTFSDISDVDEAVEYGNQLMEKGFIVHVDERHTFLSGHFFYQIAKKYARNPSKASHTGSNRWFRTGAVDNGSQEDDDASISKPTSSEGDNKVHLVISREVQVDVDLKKSSERRETVDIHLDRVYNPENAFNIQLQWLNTTQRLIDEFLISISRMIGPYGLRLVQVPVGGIGDPETISPFRTAINVKFAMDPSKIENDVTADPLEDDLYYYHNYFLHKMGFVYNATETHIEHPDFKVEYSWGKPTGAGHHWIHHTGSVLVEIKDDKTFLVVSNLIHLSRTTISNSPVSQSNNSNTNGPGDQEVLEWFKKVCGNAEVLKEMFEEARANYRNQGGSLSSQTPSMSGLSTPRVGGPELKDAQMIP